ncbi:MAG TPA: GNAT family N-acetyltransferase [Candidatus Binatia bacterium]|nr:GNAT family N-acetyltransferase [Candidatus Binatia bacterium]
MSDLELADLNYLEAMRDLTRRAGGTVVDEDGLLLYLAPHPLPVLCNGVFRTDPRVPAADVLGRARDFFGRRKRGFSVMLRAHLDADLREAAVAAGLIQMGDMPGMVLDRRLPEVAPPAGVALRRVATAADVAAYAEVMSAAYATYGMPADVMPALFPRPDPLIGPYIVSYLAYWDGRPAAGAMTVVTHGVAGIYWVGTIPEARGRGLAELCTRAAGNAGMDLGGRIAALQASPMGEPVYRRMGYAEVTRYPYVVEVGPWSSS